MSDSDNYLIVGGKELSAGVLVTDGSLVLCCLPHGRSWGKGNCDLPKGHVEIGESDVEAAVRECFEETGIDVNPDDLVALGRYDYTARKRLSLFVHFVDELPSLDSLYCSTTFEEKGREVPEIVGYKAVPLTDTSWFFPRLGAVIEKALGKLESL